MLGSERMQGTAAELGGTFTPAGGGQQHPPEDAFMVPGMGYQPVPADKYVAGNDNERFVWVNGNRVKASLVDSMPVCMPDFQEYPGAVDISEQVISYADYLRTQDRGPFVQVYPASKFYPFDPKPGDVTLVGIAHGLSRICRYSGAPEWHYSVAEHSVHMARYLACRGPVVDAMAALFHDAAEALSGFNDVGRPVKDRAPVIGQTEAAIYRLAIAPRFGLPQEIPAIVHEIDTRITADETAAAMAPMDWHGMYDRPLGVAIRCWSPTKAKEEFIETYKALARGMR